MLDGILGRGFASKCKSLIKLTKSRIDVIRRKRNATQKFLKKDMADLLANGLDINAYGRAEGLLVELTISSCYDFVENCCDFLYKHASAMQKQSECPEECREAVSSLMLAAARFSDLPELRDLRQIFQERYGSSLDHCLNRQFAEKLAPKPFAMEQKVHLMRDIASEFSISWNANKFEEQMSKASAYEREHPKDNGFRHKADDKFKVPDNGKEVPPSETNLNFRAVEASNNGQRFRKGQEADSLKKYESDLPAERNLSTNNHKVLHEREVPILRKDDNSRRGKQEFSSERRGKQEFSSERRGKESADPKITRPDASFHRKVDEWADNGTKHSRAREKNVPERDFRPGSEDNLPPSSSRSEVKVTSFFRTNGGSDHNGTNSAARVKSERDRSYADHVAATSSKSEVKVTSYFHKGGGGDDSRANTLARVKSEGDRPYEDKFAATFSKCEVKVISFIRSNGGFDHDIPNPVARVKSEGDRPYFNSALPPPYVKPNVKAKDVGHRANSEIAPANPDFNGIPKSPGKAREDVEPSIGNNPAEGEDQYKHRDEANGVLLSKARSLRRRHSKSRSVHDESRDHDEDAGIGKRSSRSRRRERDDPRRGLQILFDDERHHKDEEEKIIDKLLIHYSKKSSTHEGERVKRRSRSRHHNNTGPNLGESPLSRQADTERPDAEFGPVLPPRSVSLPREQPSAPPPGPTKVFTRAATFQLDRSDAAKHVHPKLPDYDDLAARFAALKGR